MCGPRKMFLFPLQTKVWPLRLLSISFSLPLCPLSLFLSLSLSLRADNVSANDLTALVEAPSSNWTSRDWVPYRKTILIFISDLRCSEIQQKANPDWTLPTSSRVWLEESNQVCLLSASQKTKCHSETGAINFVCSCVVLKVAWLKCTSCQMHLGVQCSPGWHLVDLRSTGLIIIKHKCVLTNSNYACSNNCVI